MNFQFWAVLDSLAIKRKCLKYFLLPNSSITDFSKLMVRCGEWDTQGDHEPLSHQDRFARKLLIHPGFVKKNLINDVAVIVLQEEFCLGKFF